MRRILALLIVTILVGLPSAAAEKGDEKPVEVTPVPSVERSGVSVLTLENTSVEGLLAKAMGDGTFRVDLNGRFRHAMILHVVADGTRTIECVVDAERAAELLKVETKESAEPDDTRED